MLIKPFPATLSFHSLPFLLHCLYNSSGLFSSFLTFLSTTCHFPQLNSPSFPYGSDDSRSLERHCNASERKLKIGKSDL